ncbi:MAG: YifB family Mg chelatase-like AAA ATPase [Spirochaetaceae bacterium]|nr:YifB family Mg chelatase-like AAA ATPase [Spirochaetaceae bacterium]
MNIVSFSPFGYEGNIVSVEVDLRRGIPAVDLVGLADNAVKEARERMRSAIINSGFDFPKERVLISLSPADLKKEGAGFDLAIALAVMINPINENLVDKTVLVMGELELSGNLRPVRGIHAAVSTAISLGIKTCIVCSENAPEACGIRGMKVLSCNNLKEAYDSITSLCDDSEEIETNEKIQQKNNSVEFLPVDLSQDFSLIKGLPFLVRGLQIAASGGHNLLAYGPPGCGKTLALQRFSSLLPCLESEESLSVTRIYSLAGLLPPKSSLIKKRPFRIPHQSASLEGMIGGGINCRPGEISLAHNGVLFLDEAAEFRTSVLQSLRVPIESGKVTLSRAGRHTVFPAEFQLLIATNPCPCGNFGSDTKICVCSAHAVEQYWKKFSGPLLDRMDIRVPVFNSSENILAEDKKQENEQISFSTEFLRKEIATAIKVQKSRQGKLNARLLPEEINYYCKLDEECNDFMNSQIKKYDFSARGVHSCIKLARTIADMQESYAIRLEDLKEAVSYRKNEGGINSIIDF